MSNFTISWQASQNFRLRWESTGLPLMSCGSPALKTESPVFVHEIMNILNPKTINLFGEVLQVLGVNQFKLIGKPRSLTDIVWNNVLIFKNSSRFLRDPLSSLKSISGSPGGFIGCSGPPGHWIW